MFVATSPTITRRSVNVPWLLVGGYVVATLDMLVAMAYWGRYGLSPSHILQSIATWLLGPGAYAGGLATAVLGAVLYGHLLWGVVALYRAVARRHPLLLHRPFLCGSVYGVLAYLAIFQVLAPLLSGTRAGFDRPLWLAVCVVTYAILVGIPCALFSRLSAAQDISRR
jgi:hypothetical protein